MSRLYRGSAAFVIQCYFFSPKELLLEGSILGTFSGSKVIEQSHPLTVTGAVPKYANGLSVGGSRRGALSKTDTYEAIIILEDVPGNSLNSLTVGMTLGSSCCR